jgi:hypothetical protein
MNKTWQEKQKESIQSGYSRAKDIAIELWLESGLGDPEDDNNFYYFQCGFVAGLNYQRKKDLEKLTELDEELGLD